MEAFNVVGTPVARSEGVEKVSGRTLYTADVNLPGTLWARIVRSPHPHARILSIDASEATRLPGVKAVITRRDIPNCYIGKQIRDMPVLCRDVVRFVGDRVAAVAAETREAAEEALELIRVEYEELPAVFDPVEAMNGAAPLLHVNVAGYDGAPPDKLASDVHNGLTRLSWRKGDVEQGFRDADIVLEVRRHSRQC